MVRLWCLAIGYVFGLFQTGFIIGKIHGIDIRNYGSGNSGTTNTLRTLGTGAGALTLLGDAFKCILAILFTRFLFGRSFPDIQPLLMMYTSAGVILGHNFPCYLHFKGGKGIASSAGMGWMISRPAFFIGLIIFALIVAVTHYVSLGSMAVYATIMIGVVVKGQLGYFGMSQAHLNEMYIVTACLTAMAVWRHRGNIDRLIHGRERKTFIFRKNKLN